MSVEDVNETDLIYLTRVLQLYWYLFDLTKIFSSCWHKIILSYHIFNHKVLLGPKPGPKSFIIALTVLP